MAADTQEITRLLIAYSDGDSEAFDALIPRVYDRLRQIAHRHMLKERSGPTLHTTDLVHEAYLGLVDQQRVPWQGRMHFFALASRVMRNILIDRARARVAEKRGAGAAKTILDGRERALEQSPEDLIALDEALSLLAERDERLVRVVEYRFFGGLTIAETAGVLGVTAMTVNRDWKKAKAWLYRLLGDGQGRDRAG